MEEKICEELAEAIAATEKLEDENETKTEMCRAAHDEQLSKIQEAKLEIEKQAEELNAKAEELSLVKKMYEEAKSNLHEKESTLEQLRDAHGKLQEENGEKLQIMEGRNNKLVSALDEANRRLEEKEHKIQSFKDEMERTEALVSTSQKDPPDGEEHNAMSHDPGQGDHDLLLELDEENEEIKNQLKCKTKEFNNLQEAHETVQQQFLVIKKEWEEEKHMLIDEISSLQAKLDYQTKISESHQRNMQLLNESLAQEENRRKQLEVQISKSSNNVNVSEESQEANSKTDEEIASLRNLLSITETLFKEAESRRECLERENHELRKSLKDYPQIEMENCHSSIMELKLQNEELYIMLTLYMSGISDAHSNLSQPKADMEVIENKEVEVKSVLIEELDQNNTSPSSKSHSEFEHKREIPESLVGEELLTMNISPSEFEREFEHKYLMTLKEFENCIDMLEESSQMENALKEDLKKVRDAFDNVSCELVEKIQEVIEIEVELERWIAVAEHLQRCLDQSLKVRREMEVSLLSQVEMEHTLKQENEHLLHVVEEKDKKADGLQREIVSLNQELLKSETETATLARMATESELDMEKEKLLQIVQEKNENINNHRKNLYRIEQEIMRRELDGMRRELENAVVVQVQTEQSLEQERDRLLQVLGKKDVIIEHLWLQITEHDLSSLIKVSTLAQHEDNKTTVDEESENVRFLDELETQVKNTVIMELEAEISGLELTLESNEKTVACTKRQVEQLEAALEAKLVEMETLRSRLGTSSDTTTTKLYDDDVEKVNGDRREEEVMRRLESFGNGDQKLTGLKVGGKYYDSDDRENDETTSPDRGGSHLIEVSN